MDGRPLPGMSWDPVRNRYFPTSSGQTRASTARNYALDSRQKYPKSKKQKLSKHDSKGATYPRPIKRPDLFPRLQLRRETGQYASASSAVFAWQYAAVALLRDEKIATTLDWPLQNRRYKPGKSFVWDSATNAMITSLQIGNDDFSRLGLFTIKKQSSARAFMSATPQSWFSMGNLGLQVFSSSISSMCLSESRILTLTTTGNSFGSELRFMGLEDPATQLAGSPPQVQFEVVFQARRNFRECDSFWSSAVLPGPNLDTTIAVGTDNDVRLYSSANGSNWTHPRCVSITEEDRVDAAISLAWMNENTIAIGQRSGTITLWDTRAGHGASSKAVRLQHPLWVNHLKFADTAGHRLVAASSLWANCMYDLRMPREAKGHGWEEATTERPNDFVGMEARSKAWSTPVVKYMINNDMIRDTGCDVSIDNGLLALGTDRCTMMLYSLHSGNLLKEFNPKSEMQDARFNLYPDTECQFVDIDGSDVLLYTRDQDIRALHWR